MYLVDTDVLSELRRAKRNPNVVEWIKEIAPTDLHICAVTVFEIEFGIEQQRRDDPAFAKRLETWLGDTLRFYGERVLPLTTNIAQRWGRLAIKVGHKELDLALAATALEHGLTVVTRNVTHYERTGVLILNPFETRARRR
jgi:predicted nucleic acid-binding protein